MKIQNNQFLSIEQLQAKYFTQSKQGGKTSGRTKYRTDGQSDGTLAGRNHKSRCERD